MCDVTVSTRTINFITASAIYVQALTLSAELHHKVEHPRFNETKGYDKQMVNTRYFVCWVEIEKLSQIIDDVISYVLVAYAAQILVMIQTRHHRLRTCKMDWQ